MMTPRPVLVRLTVVGLLASMASVTALPNPVEALEACPESAWDEATAAATAVACGEQVEVESLRGETSIVMADPAGDFVWREAATAERVQREDGTWAATDPTLKINGDGSIVPEASTVDMWFPAEGADPSVLTRFGNSELTLTLDTGSDETLPAPVIDGATATYSEVMPGVDLQLSAEVDGFAHILVVKSAEAAANPAVREAVFHTSGEGVAVKEVDGETLEAIDVESGTVLMSSGSAMMWDSAGADSSAKDSETSGDVPEPRGEQMPVAVNDGSITLSADVEMLDDPDTVYPVYIDPTWTSKDSSYATLTDTQGSTHDEPHPPVDADRGKLKVGYTDEWEVFRARSLLRMPLSRIKENKIVKKATFSITQGWSWAGCGGSQETGLYQIPKFGKDTTWSTGWNSSGSGWDTKLDSNYGVYKYGYDCAPRDVEWDATKAVKDAVGDKYVYLGLKASNESNHDAWKKFRLDAELLVRYNTAPTKPTKAQVAGQKCVSGASRPITSDSTPQFVAKVHDADDHSMTGEVYWTAKGGSFPSNPNLSQDSLKSDSKLVISPTTAISDGVYAVRMRAKDKPGSGYDPAYSGYFSCEFEVDTKAPPNPTVVSTDYPSEDTSKDGAGAIGKSGTFTIKPPSDTSDIAAYKVTLNEEDPLAGKTVRFKTGNLDLIVTPTRGADSTLRVWSVDRAGNIQDKAFEYRFNVNKIYTNPAARWSFDNLEGSSVIDDSGNGHSLTATGTPTQTPGRLLVDNGTTLDATSGYQATDSIIDTSKSFTVSAWARLDSRTSDQTILTIAGAERAGLYLKYRAENDRWWLTMPNSDAGTPTWFDIGSIAAPAMGKWTHLVAGYDAGTKNVFLYVDGVLQGQDARTTAFKATGALWVGQTATNAGKLTNAWTGGLDDVRIWDRVVVTEEAPVYAGQAIQTGHWTLDDEGDGTSSDQSGFDNALELGDGTSPMSDGAATHFNGEACAATTGPILNSNSSFSVAAWAYLDDKSSNRTVISQTGVNRPSFELKYHESLDQWAFSMALTDTASTTIVTAKAQETAQLKTWTHLAASYDASAGKIYLFVNGVLSDTQAVGGTWNTVGPLKVGCSSKATGASDSYHWSGGLDDVQVYAGVFGGISDKLTDSPSPMTILVAGGRDPGGPPERDHSGEAVSIAYDGGGRASISTIAADPDTGEWGEIRLWASATSDFYPFYSTMQVADVNGDGLNDVVLLHEQHDYEKKPEWTNSVISHRQVTVTVLLRDEYGLSEQAPNVLETIGNTADQPTAPVGAWNPGGTYLAAGDIDADGDDDVVAAPDIRDCQGGARIFRAADGEIGEPTTSPNVGTIDWCLKTTPRPNLTDMNGDGAADLAVFGTSTSGVGARVATYFANGDATLDAPVLAWSSSTIDWNSGLLKTGAGDINGSVDDSRVNPVTGQRGQGFGDLASLRQIPATGAWQLGTLLGVPNSTTVAAPVNLATPTTPKSWAKSTPSLLDFDSDGDDDLLVIYADNGTTTAWLYANNGGAFAAEQKVWTNATT